MSDSIDPTTARQALALTLPNNDAEAATIRDYLIELLAKVWEDGECFNGKRPFGNSGWEYDLYPPLIAAGLVPGRVGADGNVEDIDDRGASSLIAAAIRELR
ncbi:hypothetical protein ACH4T9_31290 [Micromonospora sp. NPDC020750]|uniref:hypothetical protein n=1 Tax=unclassified Micromonospora TaxID=2617518 RepID=UPI00379E5111